jgi:hypothetical protein
MHPGYLFLGFALFEFPCSSNNCHFVTGCDSLVLVEALNGFVNPRVSYDANFLQTVNCRLATLSSTRAFAHALQGNFVCTAKIDVFLD